MSLTDTTYYVRDVNIPLSAYNDLAESIARYERDILIQVLGYSLAKLVLAQDASQRIQDIIDGKEYTVGTYTVKWNGLLNDEKVSILSYHVYKSYLMDHSLDFQNVGVASSTVENGVNVGPAALIQRASINLRELVGYCGQDIYAPSLYNFLNNHLSDYPEWQFNEVEIVNIFGI